ncbi:hypothetical protein Tco_0260592 [Tanacetum coccineum]
MSSSTRPIIVLSDSNVEDAFSSTNTLDYTPASPNYFPASPGNTFFDPSENLSKDLLASLTISPFHDDPYIKVMQAYNATSNELHIPPPQAPIAPPTVLPSSPVLPLSPMFDPQDFFLPEETLPPQKRAHFLLSSSDFSTPPQVFEIGESSHKTHLERHEDTIQTLRIPRLPTEMFIDDILNYSHNKEEHANHLRIILELLKKEKLMAPKRTSTSAAPAMTQAVIGQLVADSVAAALKVFIGGLPYSIKGPLLL